MDGQEFEQYVKERYWPQVNWYDQKATHNKQLYRRCQWVLIAVHLDLFGRKDVLPVCTAVIVAILSAALKTFKFEELAQDYRTTCEALKKEIYLHRARVDEYREAFSPDSLFVQRVESLISRENAMWLSIIQPKKEEPDKGKGAATSK